MSNGEREMSLEEYKTKSQEILSDIGTSLLRTFLLKRYDDPHYTWQTWTDSIEYQNYLIAIAINQRFIEGSEYDFSGPGN